MILCVANISDTLHSEHFLFKEVHSYEETTHMKHKKHIYIVDTSCYFFAIEKITIYIITYIIFIY